ncbi:MAG: hypothetical protein H6718_17495 [Polyangiaceae bacterium]|nr:hypothetical protein [Polyangiaceae bacterium]MCB9609420.1 hypothetical protein [Polyangiaceae bacterium]
MRRSSALVLALGLCVAPACSGDEAAPTETIKSLADLVVSAISPGLVLPGSDVRVEGSFPDVVEQLQLRLVGSLDGSPADLVIPLERQGEVLVGSWPASAPRGNGLLVAQVVGVDAVDGREHTSNRQDWNLSSAAELVPVLDTAQGGVAFVNDAIQVTGSGFLLGGGEGHSVVVVNGCFQATTAATCEAVLEQRLVLETNGSPERASGSFAFAPRIAGIAAGSFNGSVRIENSPSQATGGSSAELPLSLELLAPRVFGLSPQSGSLGQKVSVTGGGFVAQSEDDPTPAATRLLLAGDFTLEGGVSIPVSFEIVPGFESGNELVYVINEEDALGTSADLRRTKGTLAGNITPIVSYAGETITGAPEPVELELLPVKQVVYVSFLPSYVESLRHFGMRAVDQPIRERALEVASALYAGLSVEFRTEQPEDFGLYTRIDVGGLDPNGLGLLGYDNTPGKDVNNIRLDDRVGGVNAVTQENGDPGFGGVFVESLFGFSKHPGNFATELSGADPTFDQLFDPFRPDVGRHPVLATETELIVLPSVASCDAADSRPLQIACAVHALGSLIGDTLAHELGHALGLAQPEGTGFHNSSDAPGRLMDGGSAREFRERARLAGSDRVLFCQENFAYLQGILGSGSDPEPSRPSCE